MKIYLAGSMAGGRDFEKGLVLISDTIEKMGHSVITKNNVVKSEFNKAYARKLANRRYVMARDKRRIESCDALIAEVSTYSHGVGYEHCFAESRGKPILFLRNAALKDRPYSAFLDGTSYKKFMFSFYDENNIETILKKYFKKYF